MPRREIDAMRADENIQWGERRMGDLSDDELRVVTRSFPSPNHRLAAVRLLTDRALHDTPDDRIRRQLADPDDGLSF